MKKYKSSIQRLSESRRTYRSILSEDVTDGVDGLDRIKSMQDTDMEELGTKKPRPVKPTKVDDGKNTLTCYGCENGQIITDSGFQNSNAAGICGVMNGVTMYDDQNNTNLSSCGGSGSLIDCWACNAAQGNIVMDSNYISATNGICDNHSVYGNTSGLMPTYYEDQNDTNLSSCGGNTTCDFPTISTTCAQTADLTNQFVSGNPSQFLANMATWYANPPGSGTGCDFLEVVRQKHLGHLSTGIAINGNNPNGIQMGPLWIAQKTSKVAYLDCVLAELNSQGCCVGNIKQNPIDGPESFNALEENRITRIVRRVMTEQLNNRTIK
tara:strand:- start:230 stop:1201 length:972 start_codon:yes stop_codon:yes gene_type:complete